MSGSLPTAIDSFRVQSPSRYNHTEPPFRPLGSPKHLLDSHAYHLYHQSMPTPSSSGTETPTRDSNSASEPPTQLAYNSPKAYSRSLPNLINNSTMAAAVASTSTSVPHQLYMPPDFPHSGPSAPASSTAGPGTSTEAAFVPQQGFGPTTQQQGLLPQYPLQDSGSARPSLSPIDTQQRVDSRNDSISPEPNTNDSMDFGDGGNDSVTASPYESHQIKHRRRTTPGQLEILDAHFQICPKPDMPARKKLSVELNMTVREVQVWFQNRRAKQKKLDARSSASKAEQRNLHGHHTDMLGRSGFDGQGGFVGGMMGGRDLESTLARYTVPSQQKPSGISYASGSSNLQQGFGTYTAPRQPYYPYNSSGTTQYMQNIRPAPGPQQPRSLNAYPMTASGHPSTSTYSTIPYNQSLNQNTMQGRSPINSPTTINLNTPSRSTASVSPDGGYSSIPSQQHLQQPQHYQQQHLTQGPLTGGYVRGASSSSNSSTRTPSSEELPQRRGVNRLSEISVMPSNYGYQSGAHTFAYSPDDENAPAPYTPLSATAPHNTSSSGSNPSFAFSNDSSFSNSDYSRQTDFVESFQSFQPYVSPPEYKSAVDTIGNHQQTTAGQQPSSQHEYPQLERLQIPSNGSYQVGQQNVNSTGYFEDPSPRGTTADSSYVNEHPHPQQQQQQQNHQHQQPNQAYLQSPSDAYGRRLSTSGLDGGMHATNPSYTASGMVNANRISPTGVLEASSYAYQSSSSEGNKDPTSANTHSTISPRTGPPRTINLTSPSRMRNNSITVAPQNVPGSAVSPKRAQSGPVAVGTSGSNLYAPSPVAPSTRDYNTTLLNYGGS